jgi:hypothetical protein
VGDMGDTFNAMREAGKERRASNRETTPDLLRRHGIPFDTKNGGAHLIVYHGGKIADLWPGTGKYRRGVFNMLRDLGVGIMVDKRETRP